MPHQCRKCMTINMRDKYKCCIMCTKYKSEDFKIYFNDLIAGHPKASHGWAYEALNNIENLFNEI